MLVTNTEDIIDSWDILCRIEALRRERDAWEDKQSPWEVACPEDAEELAAMEALAEQCKKTGDWGHGDALIHDNYFPAYIDEMADDLIIHADENWLTHDEVVEILLEDYKPVDFDGVKYWVGG